MHFFTMTRIYRDPEDAISLRDVWMIVDGELNGAAAVAWERLRSEKELALLHREVAWAAQAVLEFADLVDFTRPAKGRVQYRNYLYFEATSALREAAVGMLNGSPRAASGLLRSVMEMLLLHCWWQERISRKGSAFLHECCRYPDLRFLDRVIRKAYDICEDYDTANELFDGMANAASAAHRDTAATADVGGNAIDVGHVDPVRGLAYLDDPQSNESIEQRLLVRLRGTAFQSNWDSRNFVTRARFAHPPCGLPVAPTAREVPGRTRHCKLLQIVQCRSDPGVVFAQFVNSGSRRGAYAFVDTPVVDGRCGVTCNGFGRLPNCDDEAPRASAMGGVRQVLRYPGVGESAAAISPHELSGDVLECFPIRLATLIDRLRHQRGELPLPQVLGQLGLDPSKQESI